MSRNSEITIKVTLDEKNVPEKMEWNASDSGFAQNRECKAIVVSLFDSEEGNAFRIDLWTKEMRIDEMDKFVYQTLMTMAETYGKATNNQKGAGDIINFAHQFGEKAGIVKKKQ